MLSGLGNTTIVIAATDAANALRVCHIGNLITNELKDVLNEYLFKHFFIIKSPICRLRTDLAASMAATTKDV